jgi:hypothetical protein
MAYSSHYEYKLDHGGGKSFASRNYNDTRHVFDKWGVDRSQVDWVLQLRQVKPPAEKLMIPDGAPQFSESREKPTKTKAPEEAEYQQQKYGNTATSGHMLRIGDAVNTKTVRPIHKEQVHFQTTLRERKPIGNFENKEWRRYFGRYQVSFDRMQDNCGKDNDAYQTSHITPQDRRPDRSNSALPIATLRDASDYCFEGKPDEKGRRTKMRFPGCEGSSWTQWSHLVHPGKVRDMIKWETTLHGYPDNRQDQVLTDMRGKKKYGGRLGPSTAPDKTTYGSDHNRAEDPYGRNAYGDPKLEYLRIHPPGIQAESYVRKRVGYPGRESVGDELSKNVRQGGED